METIHGLIQEYLEREDKAVLVKILEEIKTTEHLWTVLVRATNNFYMGFENEKPAAYLFSDKEFADNFAREVRWGGVQAKVIEIAAEQRIAFFNDLYRSGIEAVAVDQSEDSLVMSLFGIIDKPEEELFVNPPLVRAANQFYQALSKKRAVKPMQDLLCREVYRAELLAPIAEVVEEGEGCCLSEKKEKPAYAYLSNQNGEKYLPVFTDWTEFAKYDKKKKHTAVKVSFADIKKQIRKVDGIAVNPLGFNLILDQSKMENIETLISAQETLNGDKIISLKDRMEK